MDSSFDLIRDTGGRVVGKELKSSGIIQDLGRTPLFAEPVPTVIEVTERVEDDPVHGTYYRFVERTEDRIPTVFDLPDNPYVTGRLDYLEMRATARVWGTRKTDSEGVESTWFDLDLTKVEPEIVGTSGALAADIYHEEVIRHIGRARDEQLRRFGVTLTGWVDFLNEGRRRGRPTARTLLDWARLATIASSAEGSARQALQDFEPMSDETAKDLLKRMRGLTGNPIRDSGGEVLVFLEMSRPQNRPTYSATSLTTALIQFAAR